MLIHLGDVAVKRQVASSDSSRSARCVEHDRKEAVKGVFPRLAARLQTSGQVERIEIARGLVVIADRSEHRGNPSQLCRWPGSGLRVHRLRLGRLSAARSLEFGHPGAPVFEVIEQAASLRVIAFVDEDAEKTSHGRKIDRAAANALLEVASNDAI